MGKELTGSKEFNIYFYNGFDKPELVATSIEQFEEDVKITDHRLLLDTEGSDVTDEVVASLKEYRDGLIYKEEIEGGLIVNPTILDLINMNKAWFRGRDLLTYLDDFIDRVADMDSVGQEIAERFGEEVLEYDMTEDELNYYVNELGYVYIDELGLYIR